MKDNELIREYVETQVEWAIKTTNTNYSTTKLQKRCKKLEQELVKRNILTEEDVKHINM